MRKKSPLVYLAFLSIATPSTVALAHQVGEGGVRQTQKELERLQSRVAELEGQEAGSGGFDTEKFYGDISFKQDTFFGFQTIFGAGYEIRDNVDFTFYSWLWTNPNFGRSLLDPTSPQGGEGLWTEVGAGLNFRFLDDALSVNPNIGMLNGALLSSDVIGRDIQAGEGVVPNLTINYDTEFFTSELYLAYYMAIRDDRNRDFLHTWANGGVRPAAFGMRNAPVSSVGLHWENLRQIKTREGPAPDNEQIYQWLGPYVEFALPKHFSMRFAGGIDLTDDSVSSEFYQATVNLSF